MVQRKVLNKLGIQADHVKSEKGLVNLKPSSSQHQDSKNKGADLKKKMKKSRSIKRSDFESLRSSPPLRQEISQPGKPPPPDHVLTRAATPQKYSPNKAPEASPNYMKSTTSFDARKESSQVSTWIPQTSIISKSSSPKKSNNLKHSSASGHKAAGTLARTSSLKLVRTKTPSFKPARASVKKYSPVVLCENLDVQKPTCSSTLKDSKFPAYLTLSPGATESEGTSTMKVCPYTYCSLNGHHHARVPPLKCFLSTKRRMMKAQKTINLGCLSPRRAKPFGYSKMDTDAGHMIFAEKPAIEELDLNSSPITPLMQEEQRDFYIEIYSNNRDDTADAIGGIKHDGDDKGMTDSSVDDIMPLVGATYETAAAIADGKILESLPGTSQCSDIDFEDNFNRHSDDITTEMNIIDLFTEEDQNVEAAEEAYPIPMAKEETPLECLSKQCNSDEESQPRIQQGQPDSEASDMEWEEGHYYEPSLHDVPIIKLKEIGSRSIYDKPISKSDDNISSSFEDIIADEVLVGFYDEESVSSDTWLDDGDSELDGSYQNMESDESLVSNEQSQDQLYSTYDASEELATTDEKDGNSESNEMLGKESTWVPIEDHMEESKATSEDKSGVPEASNEIPKIDLQLGVDETKCTSDIEEALIGHQENKSGQDDYASGLLGNQDSNYSHDSTEQDQDETDKDYNVSHNSIEVYQFDSTSESRFSNEVSDASLLLKTEDSETDQDYHEEELPTADASDEMEEKEQLLAAKSLIGIRTFDLLQDFFEPNREKTEDNDESKLAVVATEIETSETFADEGLPDEIQDHSSNYQSQSNDVESQDCSEINQDGAENNKITNSICSEYQTHSGVARLRSAENSDQGVDTMEGKYTSNSDAEETCSTAKDTYRTETKDLLSHVQSNSNEEIPKTCKNPSWTIGSRRPVEELEENRNFNPREPNYLPVEPDPDAEKVDLRHQMTDERKNAEEWMIDYALQQAVTKLAPARKRKVALLVEAFEKVLPIPKYEAHLRHTSAAFVHARTIQACR